MLLSSQVFITAWPGQVLLDTSPNLLYAFICVGKWLMCFLPSFHTLRRVDVAGVCGFATQSSQSDSLWLLREVVITYCPPTTAIVQIQIPVWSHQKSVQGVTPAYSCFLACFFFLLVYLLKLSYPWNPLQTVSCQEKNAEKSSDLHFYIRSYSKICKEK